jgi:hypothetical protein
MDELFRLQHPVRRDPAIELWLGKQVPELGAIAREWFARIRACGDDVRELMHDECPTACVVDAAFAYVNVFRVHVNVGFFHGVELEDPVGLLQGSGRWMRHVKVRPGQSLDRAALGDLIDAAYDDIRWRLEVE